MRGMVPGGSSLTLCRRRAVLLIPQTTIKTFGHWTNALETFALKAFVASVTKSAVRPRAAASEKNLRIGYCPLVRPSLTLALP